MRTLKGGFATLVLALAATSAGAAAPNGYLEISFGICSRHYLSHVVHNALRRQREAVLGQTREDLLAQRRLG